MADAKVDVMVDISFRWFRQCCASFSLNGNEWRTDMNANSISTFHQVKNRYNTQNVIDHRIFSVVSYIERRYLLLEHIYIF